MEGVRMRFGKVYHGRGEETFRRELWEDNREYVILNNAIAPMAESTYTMRVNQFSDMTEHEQNLQPPRYMNVRRRNSLRRRNRTL
ncbi:hypothetical protein BSL78_16664 [Apostichopus japonicus]|uniref:Cathepsin propeptide inhibitor domain-containing protein n=1 Tax=Stichopus japonicus TaxID=307972 RepID=A0A2G8KEP1_STIJA|nr:hypothetical protein BSL78_16664 [Apostichopus japonicus]